MGLEPIREGHRLAAAEAERELRVVWGVVPEVTWSCLFASRAARCVRSSSRSAHHKGARECSSLGTRVHLEVSGWAEAGWFPSRADSPPGLPTARERWCTASQRPRLCQRQMCCTLQEPNCTNPRTAATTSAGQDDRHYTPSQRLHHQKPCSG